MQALALELATTKDKLADAIADLQDRNNNQEEEGRGGVPERQRPNVVYEPLAPHPPRGKKTYRQEDRSPNHVSTRVGGLSANGMGMAINGSSHPNNPPPSPAPSHFIYP